MSKRNPGHTAFVPRPTGPFTVLTTKRVQIPQDQVRAQLGLPVSKQLQLQRTVSIAVPPAAAAAAAAADEPEEKFVPISTQPEDWDVEPQEQPEDVQEQVVIDLTASDDEEPKEPENKKPRKSPTQGKSKLIYYDKVYVKQGKALVEAFVKKVGFFDPNVIWGEIIHSEVETDVDDATDLM
jgi:hypothetical protein